MKNFEVITPSDLSHASKLLARPGHIALAGGVDTIDLMKQDLVAPSVLVNLKELKELRGIEHLSDGTLRVGALARLSEVALDKRINEQFTALSEAANEAATPQIRNLGTVGGNLLQRPRCWYFRHPDVHCLKKGGEKCYAIGGLNRYHSIFGGGPSYIVHPSNLAPALMALGARLKIFSASGEREVTLDNFFTLPSVDPTRENSRKAGEILTAVVIPPIPGLRSNYMEVREKQSFDWPLVSVAVALSRKGQPLSASVVLGAVAPVPWRATEAEKVLRETVKEGALDERAAAAAADAALKNAQPMSDNAYKVVLAKVLIRRALIKAVSQGPARVGSLSSPVSGT